VSEIKQYRKKPVIIEAMQLNAGKRGNLEVVINWAGARQWYVDMDNHDECYMCLSTLEGIMKARNGDWVIRGVKGEFYPCKPDIFEQIYEEVAE
jgi:hypothetical protein